jgi:hypothetical protein
MREHWFWQVHPNVRDGLPLCLVNSHCEAVSNRELFSLKLEREHLIVRAQL